jgi:oligosaccharyltransferase complex subunit beta
MRLPLLGLFLGFVSFVAALSTQGSQLLVVIEDVADKSKYSQFWSDLEGKQANHRTLPPPIGASTDTNI